MKKLLSLALLCLLLLPVRALAMEGCVVDMPPGYAGSVPRVTWSSYVMAPDIGGRYWDSASKRMCVLLVNGGTQARRQEIAALPEYVGGVTFISCKYSYAQLQAIMDQLAIDMRSGNGAVHAGIDEKENCVAIGILKGTPETVAQGYIWRYGDMVRIEEGAIGLPKTDPGSMGTAVTTGKVNIRQGPGTSYAKLGKLRKGQTVAVWAIYGKWAEITWTGNQNGYVHTDYIRFDSEDVTAPDGPALDVPSTDPGSAGSAVATEKVNVRLGPGKSYGKLGKLRKGQMIAVWGIYGKWAEITWTGSQKGYVYTDYLEIGR